MFAFLPLLTNCIVFVRDQYPDMLLAKAQLAITDESVSFFKQLIQESRAPSPPTV